MNTKFKPGQLVLPAGGRMRDPAGYVAEAAKSYGN